MDILSSGRLRLGVGTGWNYVEFDSLNENFSNRGKRQEDQINVLRELWKSPVIDYQSAWHKIERAGLNPLPEKKIPIWLGGFKEVALKRAAAIGDGFIFGSGQKENLASWDSLKKYLNDANRDGSDFGVEALLNFQSGPKRWREDIEAWINVGASHVSMREWRCVVRAKD